MREVLHMFEIRGKYATAVCYASVAADNAVEQIRRMCDCEFTAGCTVRIMPDVHAGKGCTVGTTMTVKDKVVPNIVGVDIGCGMYTVNLGTDRIDLEMFDRACHNIPSGRNVREIPAEDFDLSSLRCSGILVEKRRLAGSLGTLGGGNHFIEIDRSDSGTNYLVIHTGSRNLGKQVAEYYQKIAVDLNRGGDEYYHAVTALVEEYKAEGRQKEIEKALRELKRMYTEKITSVPQELCWLEGRYFEDYLHDIEICQQFAGRNRELIAEDILGQCGLTAYDSFHTIHNYIDTKEMILRKGAIAAHQGERILIPINMRDGSILAAGRGNREWNQSAPHGAGRILSRSQAKETLTIEEYRKSMEGIYTSSVCPQTLDEAPMAYKSIDVILNDIGETADVQEIIRPVYNFKAAD